MQLKPDAFEDTTDHGLNVTLLPTVVLIIFSKFMPLLVVAVVELAAMLSSFKICALVRAAHNRNISRIKCFINCDFIINMNFVDLSDAVWECIKQKP